MLPLRGGQGDPNHVRHRFLNIAMQGRRGGPPTLKLKAGNVHVIEVKPRRAPGPQGGRSGPQGAEPGEAQGLGEDTPESVCRRGPQECIRWHGGRQPEEPPYGSRLSNDGKLGLSKGSAILGMPNDNNRDHFS